MPIPPDFKIKAGRYQRDADGVVMMACNCPGSKLTMAVLAANRDKYTPWPAPVKAAPPVNQPAVAPQGVANAGQTV